MSVATSDAIDLHTRFYRADCFKPEQAGKNQYESAKPLGRHATMTQISQRRADTCAVLSKRAGE